MLENNGYKIEYIESKVIDFGFGNMNVLCCLAKKNANRRLE